MDNNCGSLIPRKRFTLLRQPAMATASCSGRLSLDELTIRRCLFVSNHHSQSGGEQLRRVAVSIARRPAILLSVLPPTLIFPSQPSEARERRNRKSIPIEEYRDGPNGLKYYDLEVGKGPVVEKGTTVQVHFDCVYGKITAVSSRESKLLAGNRIIAQPYEFKVGAPPGKERKRDFVDNPNGLFSAQAAPKPPPAMYTITEGMKVGGKRTVIVPPELGYGSKGMNEIPPGATFNLNIELLEIVSPEGK